MSLNVGPQLRSPRHVPTLPGSGAPGDFIYTDDTGSSYIANNAGSYQIVDVGSGDGDVVGPASSTDNAVVRFDSTTGKLVQNSGVIIDDNNNITSSNVAAGFATTATAAGTTTLTVASKGIQEFTGATTQTVTLPVVSTLPQTGFGFMVINRSSGVVTVNSSGGNAVQAMAASTSAIFTCVLLTGTSAASWDVTYIGATGISGTLGSTDNALTRADGTGGSTAQGSAATVDDSGNLALGTTPATSGILRFPNNQFLNGRNAANGANLPVIGVSATDQVEIGSAASVTIFKAPFVAFTSSYSGDIYVYPRTAAKVGFYFGSNVSVPTAGVIGFAADATSAFTTGIAENASGLLEVNSGTAGTFRDVKTRKYFADQTITAGGTTGNQTINKAAGTVNIAAGNSTVTVTSDQCTTSSTVFAVIRTNDATATIKNVVPGSGSFVITLTAAATGEISIGFSVTN